MRVSPLILLVLLAACSGSTEPTGRARLVVWPNPDTLPADSTLQLHAYLITANDDTILDVAPVWASRNPDVAPVSADGVVTGMQSGQVTIVAQTPDARGSATVRVERRFHALDVAVGSHVCAVDLEGKAWCTYGFGSGITTGTPDSADLRTFTVPAAGTARFSMIGAGGNMTCGLDLMGAAYCWGQYIIGYTLSAAIPVRVDASTAFDTLSVAGTSACGIAGGTARCWGQDRPDVQDISTAGSPLGFVATGLDHACAISSGQDMFCWHAAETEAKSVGSGFVSLGVGNGSACALRADGSGACFNPDVSSDTSRLGSNLPLRQVVLGQNFMCGLTLAGVAYCTGANDHGQLGGSSSTEPVKGNHLFARLAASPGSADFDPGPDRVCGITTSSELFCWGEGFGPIPSPVLY